MEQQAWLVTTHHEDGTQESAVVGKNTDHSTGDTLWVGSEAQLFNPPRITQSPVEYTTCLPAHCDGVEALDTPVSYYYPSEAERTRREAARVSG